MSASEADSRKSISEYETELKKLQEAVSHLERSDLPLEEAFRRWEAGCASYVACRRILEEARARIEVLARNFAGEEPAWEPFRAGAGEGTGVDSDDPDGEGG